MNIDKNEIIKWVDFAIASLQEGDSQTAIKYLHEAKEVIEISEITQSKQQFASDDNLSVKKTWNGI